MTRQKRQNFRMQIGFEMCRTEVVILTCKCFLNSHLAVVAHGQQKKKREKARESLNLNIYEFFVCCHSPVTIREGKAKTFLSWLLTDGWLWACLKGFDSDKIITERPFCVISRVRWRTRTTVLLMLVFLPFFPSPPSPVVHRKVVKKFSHFQEGKCDNERHFASTPPSSLLGKTFSESSNELFTKAKH